MFSFWTDGHDKNALDYKWRKDPTCTAKCDEVYIYDRDMANFQILEAKKTKEATVYHAGKWDLSLFEIFPGR